MEIPKCCIMDQEVGGSWDMDELSGLSMGDTEFKSMHQAQIVMFPNPFRNCFDFSSELFIL